MLTYVLLGTNDLDRATRFYDATLTLLGSAASPATRMGSPRQAGEPMRMMPRANWRSGSESHSMHGIRADLNRGTGPGPTPALCQVRIIAVYRSFERL
jgi:hypothetical protein